MLFVLSSDFLLFPIILRLSSLLYLASVVSIFHVLLLLLRCFRVVGLWRHYYHLVLKFCSHVGPFCCPYFQLKLLIFWNCDWSLFMNSVSLLNWSFMYCILLFSSASFFKCLWKLFAHFDFYFHYLFSYVCLILLSISWISYF